MIRPRYDYPMEVSDGEIVAGWQEWVAPMVDEQSTRSVASSDFYEDLLGVAMAEMADAEVSYGPSDSSLSFPKYARQRIRLELLNERCDETGLTSMARRHHEVRIDLEEHDALLDDLMDDEAVVAEHGIGFEPSFRLPGVAVIHVSDIDNKANHYRGVEFRDVRSYVNFLREIGNPLPLEDAPVEVLAPDKDPVGDYVVNKGNSHLIDEAISLLADPSSEIIRLRFGFTDDEIPRTGAEVAEMLGLTERQVLYAEKRSISLMGHPQFMDCMLKDIAINSDELADSHGQPVIAWQFDGDEYFD